MANAELAHWRYQVRNLEQWKLDNRRSLRYSESDAHRYPDSPGMQTLLADHIELTNYGAWLLEEARFMSELLAV